MYLSWSRVCPMGLASFGYLLAIVFKDLPDSLTTSLSSPSAASRRSAASVKAIRSRMRSAYTWMSMEVVSGCVAPRSTDSSREHFRKGPGIHHLHNSDFSHWTRTFARPLEHFDVLSPYFDCGQGSLASNIPPEQTIDLLLNIDTPSLPPQQRFFFGRCAHLRPAGSSQALTELHSQYHATERSVLKSVIQIPKQMATPDNQIP